MIVAVHHSSCEIGEEVEVFRVKENQLQGTCKGRVVRPATIDEYRASCEEMQIGEPVFLSGEQFFYLVAVD